MTTTISFFAGALIGFVVSALIIFILIGEKEDKDNE